MSDRPDISNNIWQSGAGGPNDHNVALRVTPHTDYTPALLTVIAFSAGLLIGLLLGGITVRVH